MAIMLILRVSQFARLKSRPIKSLKISNEEGWSDFFREPLKLISHCEQPFDK